MVDQKLTRLPARGDAKNRSCVADLNIVCQTRGETVLQSVRKLSPFKPFKPLTVLQSVRKLSPFKPFKSRILCVFGGRLGVVLQTGSNQGAIRTKSGSKQGSNTEGNGRFLEDQIREQSGPN